MLEERNGNWQTNLFPLSQLGAAFSGGILLSNAELPLRFIVVGALAGTFGCAVFLLIGRFTPAIVLLLLAFVCCGSALATLERRPAEHDRLKRLLDERVITPGAPIEVTGVLQQNPEASWGAVYFTINVERIRVSGCDRPASGVVSMRVPVSAGNSQLQELQLRYGARIRVMTMLDRSDNYRNPGVSPFTEYLDRKGYDASASVKSPHLIERLDDKTVFLPLAWAYDWRTQLQQQIDARLSRETAGVLDAALLGNRYNLTSSAEERFRDGGTFHVLVISGLHITFLGGLVFIIVKRLTRNRLVQFVVAAGVVWGYSIAVGAEPSILRAALMFSVVLLAPLASRHASPLNGLGAVAIALLLWKPSALFDPSFQLTFVSVLAILILAWPLLQTLAAIGAWRPARAYPYPPACPGWLRRFAEALYWDERAAVRHLQSAGYEYSGFKSKTAATLQSIHAQRLARFVFAAVVVSISVQLTLLPFLIIYFHRFSPASLVLNIFVGVGIAAVAMVALVGVMTAQISLAVSEPLFLAANSLNWLMVHSVDPFTRAQVASIRVPEYTGPLFSVYFLYYLPLATLSFLLMKWRPLDPPKNERASNRSRSVFWIVGCVHLAAVAVLIFHPGSAAVSDGNLRVDFLDVGQGDAALITFPDATTALVDGGGKSGPFQNDDEESGRTNRAIGESVVSEYLWWRGLDHIDYLVSTHADADHIDGLNDIARNFNVRSALVARLPERDAEFGKLLQMLKINDVAVRAIGAGDELWVSGVLLRVLWPHPSKDPRLPSGNNDSLVLRVEYGTRAILLTGDIEARAERALVARQARVIADVTKVPHHGSRTSSTEEFVRSTRSKLAVISVGESSAFGHPNAEVVRRWEENGAQILRTGNRGMITLVTDGKTMHYTTFVNP